MPLDYFCHDTRQRRRRRAAALPTAPCRFMPPLLLFAARRCRFYLRHALLRHAMPRAIMARAMRDDVIIIVADMP